MVYLGWNRSTSFRCFLREYLAHQPVQSE
jgi:hypothetical protein